MGLFGKSHKDEKVLPEMPKLPELPKLPTQKSLPEIPKEEIDSATPLVKDLPEVNALPTIPEEKEIHQLPSFPNNSLGEKISQDTIKNAVSGGPEMTDEEKMMEQGPKEFNPMTEPMERNPEIERRIIPKMPIEDEYTEIAPKSTTPIVQTERRVKIDEPIFIRIDKFEESMKVFDSIKEKVSDIEHLLRETKEIKDKEQLELSEWEQEVQKLKLQIEKVDQDIFSKIE